MIEAAQLSDQLRTYRTRCPHITRRTTAAGPRARVRTKAVLITPTGSPAPAAPAPKPSPPAQPAYGP
ncbi:hypothetical protein ACWCXK_37035 [Streptomyces sp. NPDC001739]